MQSLKLIGETLRNDLRDAMEWNWLDDDAPERMRYLDRTPKQALAEIKAQAIEEMHRTPKQALAEIKSAGY